MNKKHQAIIRITSDEENTNISLEFSPAMDLKDESKNPACHFTAAKMIELYAKYKESTGKK